MQGLNKFKSRMVHRYVPMVTPEKKQTNKKRNKTNQACTLSVQAKHFWFLAFLLSLHSVDQVCEFHVFYFMEWLVVY